MMLFQLQMLYGIKWDDSEWRVDKNLTDSGHRAKLYPADRGKPRKTNDSVGNNLTVIQNCVLPNPSALELNVWGYCEKYTKLNRCLHVTGVEISWLLLFTPYNVHWLSSTFSTKRLNTSLRHQNAHFRMLHGTLIFINWIFKVKTTSAGTYTKVPSNQ